MGNDATQFQIGSYNVYSGVTLPTDGEGITLTAGVPTGGTLLGITDGELNFKYTPKIAEILGQQGNGILNAFLSDEEVEGSFSLKQVQDFTLLGKILMGSLAFTDTGKTPDQNLLGLGGINEIPSAKRISWCFVTKRPYQATDYYLYILFYEAVATGDFSLALSKDKESIVQVTLKPIAQLARTVGRQIALIGKETA